MAWMKSRGSKKRLSCPVFGSGSVSSFTRPSFSGKDLRARHRRAGHVARQPLQGLGHVREGAWAALRDLWLQAFPLQTSQLQASRTGRCSPRGWISISTIAPIGAIKGPDRQLAAPIQQDRAEIDLGSRGISCTLTIRQDRADWGCNEHLLSPTGCAGTRASRGARPHAAGPCRPGPVLAPVHRPPRERKGERAPGQAGGSAGRPGARAPVGAA